MEVIKKLIIFSLIIFILPTAYSINEVNLDCESSCDENGVCGTGESIENCFIDCDWHCIQATKLAQDQKDALINGGSLGYTGLHDDCKQEAINLPLGCQLAWTMAPEACRLVIFVQTEENADDLPDGTDLYALMHGDDPIPDGWTGYDIVLDKGEDRNDVISNFLGVDPDPHISEVRYPFNPLDSGFCWNCSCNNSSPPDDFSHTSEMPEFSSIGIILVLIIIGTVFFIKRRKQ